MVKSCFSFCFYVARDTVFRSHQQRARPRRLRAALTIELTSERPLHRLPACFLQPHLHHFPLAASSCASIVDPLVFYSCNSIVYTLASFVRTSIVCSCPVYRDLISLSLSNNVLPCPPPVAVTNGKSCFSFCFYVARDTVLTNCFEFALQMLSSCYTFALILL